MNSTIIRCLNYFPILQLRDETELSHKTHCKQAQGGYLISDFSIQGCEFQRSCHCSVSHLLQNDH